MKFVVSIVVGLLVAWPGAPALARSAKKDGQPVLGQSAPSHLDDPEKGAMPRDIKRFLDSERKTGLTAREVGSPLDEKTIEDFIEHNKSLLTRTNDQKIVTEFLNKNKGILDNAPDIERLKHLLKDKSNRGIAQEDLEKLVNSIAASKNTSGHTDNAAGKTAAPSKPPAANPQRGRRTGGVKTKKDDQIEDFARWLSRNFEDSSLAKDMIKEFTERMQQEGGMGQKDLLDGLGQEFQSLTGPADGGLSDGWGSLFSDLSLPNLAPRGRSDGRTSGYSTSFGSSGTGVGWTILIVLGAVGAVLIGYALYTKADPQRRETARAANRSATIDPRTITNREDVVKAFDALSVSRCGADAANWNHRQVADQLASRYADCRDSVESLAGLYEKARYAPRHDSFTEFDVAEARDTLAQLTESTA